MPGLIATTGYYGGYADAYDYSAGAFAKATYYGSTQFGDWDTVGIYPWDAVAFAEAEVDDLLDYAEAYADAYTDDMIACLQR